MPKEFPESLLEFEHWFRTEEACREYLAKLRWPSGFICPQCSSTRAWLARRNYFHCAGCRRDVSVTAGTVFHRSHLPLRVWFRIAWWMTNQKSGLNALDLQRMLGIGSYETAWLSLQKLRRAMVRLGRDQLTGDIEVDETFVGGLKKGDYAKKGKTLVAIAAEIRGEGIGRIRLGRINDNSTQSLMPFVRNVAAGGSTIVTDGWWPYGTVVDHGYIHRPTTLRGKGDKAAITALPRVHRVASLMKRWMLGMHQGRISGDKIDPYLDEFAFRFNRRLSPSRGQLFFRLLEQCVVHGPTRYAQIVGIKSR
jgi:transposase-like protein